MSEWIKCSDKMPDCKNVLAVFVSEKDQMYKMNHQGWFRDTIYSCYVGDGKFVIESHGPILPATHWMPLPKLPKNDI